MKHDNVIVVVETDEGISGTSAAHGGPEASNAMVEQVESHGVHPHHQSVAPLGESQRGGWWLAPFLTFPHRGKEGFSPPLGESQRGGWPLAPFLAFSHRGQGRSSPPLGESQREGW